MKQEGRGKLSLIPLVNLIKVSLSHPQKSRPWCLAEGGEAHLHGLATRKEDKTSFSKESYNNRTRRKSRLIYCRESCEQKYFALCSHFSWSTKQKDMWKLSPNCRLLAASLYFHPQDLRKPRNKNF